MKTYEGQERHTHGVISMTIDEQATLLGEVMDNLVDAYAGLIQLGNSPTFAEVRGSIAHDIEQLEIFV